MPEENDIPRIQDTGLQGDLTAQMARLAAGLQITPDHWGTGGITRRRMIGGAIQGNNLAGTTVRPTKKIKRHIRAFFDTDHEVFKVRVEDQDGTTYDEWIAESEELAAQHVVALASDYTTHGFTNDARIRTDNRTRGHLTREQRMMFGTHLEETNEDEFGLNIDEEAIARDEAAALIPADAPARRRFTLNNPF